MEYSESDDDNHESPSAARKRSSRGIPTHFCYSCPSLTMSQPAINVGKQKVNVNARRQIAPSAKVVLWLVLVCLPSVQDYSTPDLPLCFNSLYFSRYFRPLHRSSRLYRSMLQVPVISVARRKATYMLSNNGGIKSSRFWALFFNAQIPECKTLSRICARTSLHEKS